MIHLEELPLEKQLKCADFNAWHSNSDSIEYLITI